MDGCSRLRVGSDLTEYRSGDYQRAFGRLCHVAALSRDGRVQAALDSLVTTTLVLDADTGGTTSDLETGVAGYFGLRPPHAEIEASVGRLIAAGAAVRAGPGQVRVTEETSAAVELRSREAQQLEFEVRAEWLEQVSALDPPVLGDPETQWRALTAFMALAFRRHGVQTLRLLSPGLDEEDRSDGSVGQLLDDALADTGVGAADRTAVEVAIAAFFNTQTDLRTRYLAQLLDATFTFFALTADDVTSEYLRRGLQPLSVFLDTNFIFGVIGFHADHFVEMSSEIVELIRQQHLPFKLYYHERTLRELQDTIAAIGRRMKARHWSQALSRAALRTAMESGALSSVELAYHEVNASTPTTPDVFLSKYENIEPLLEAQGFKIYREAGKPSHTVEEKGRLIADYAAFIRDERPARPKPYEAIDHDIVLWLAVSRLRQNRRSVLGSGALFLTNDFLLNRYAWRHLRMPGEISGVVVPLQLLQILRPFVPTTDDLDRRFVENFSIPEFRTVQSNYSQVAANVLSFLAMYADVPEETAVRILTDNVLKSRLRKVSEDSPEFKELIDSAILDANRELLEEREALAAEVDNLRGENVSIKKEADSAIRAEASRRQAAEREAAESHALASSSTADLRAVQEALTREAAENKTAEAAELSLTASLERDLEAQKRIARWLLFAVIAIVGIVAIWIAQAVVEWSWLSEHPRRWGLLLIASVIWSVIAWSAAHRSLAGAGAGAVAVAALTAILAFAALIDG